MAGRDSNTTNNDPDGIYVDGPNGTLVRVGSWKSPSLDVAIGAGVLQLALKRTKTQDLKK